MVVNISVNGAGTSAVSSSSRTLTERIRERVAPTVAFDLGNYNNDARMEWNSSKPNKKCLSNDSPSRSGMDDEEDQSFFSLWRLDPSESHSDWTIILQDEEEDSESATTSSNTVSPDAAVTKFHVHKNLLGVGPYKSEYFSRLFRLSPAASLSSSSTSVSVSRLLLAESKTSTSYITLPSSAIVAFPIMLDFVYSRGCTPDPFHTSYAVEIRFLSSYFGVPKLFSAISQFIQESLNPSNCIEYLGKAMTYRDDKLIEASCATCAKNFEHLTKDQINMLSPDMLQAVICSPVLQCESEELSCRIAEYCRRHPDIIDASWLRNVTSQCKMPRIFPEEALFLLNLAVKHLSVDLQDLPTTITTTNTATQQQPQQQEQQRSLNSPEIFPLKDRCISACSEYWTEVLLRTDTSFNSLPENVKVELLLSALQTAGKEIDSANSDVDIFKRQVREKQQAIDRLATEVQTHKRITSIQERKIFLLEQQLQNHNINGSNDSMDPL